MPELPEVETIARGVARQARGERIESVWLSDKPQTFKSPPRLIARTLEGATIREVRRVGKHIVVDLEREAAPHLPAAGSRVAKGRKAGKYGAPKRERTPTADAKAKTESDSKAESNAKSKAADEDVRVVGAQPQWIVHLGMTGSLCVTA